MKRKYFAFHFAGGNYDLTYETDGEGKTETIEKVRGALRGRRYKGINLQRTAELANR